MIGKSELNKVPREFDLNQGIDGGRCGLKPNALLQLSATKAPQKSKRKNWSWNDQHRWRRTRA
jgi:hypothetical protein